jgi:hypothetical protein
MPRLNRKAVTILLTELQHRPDAEVRKQAMVRDYLQQLVQQPGEPITLEELRAKVLYLFPDFNDVVLQQAANANSAPVASAPVASAPVAATSSSAPPASFPVGEVTSSPSTSTVSSSTVACKQWWWRLKLGAIVLGSGCSSWL